MNFKNSIKFLFLVVFAIVFSFSLDAKKPKQTEIMPPSVLLRMSEEGQRARFVNLEKGIRINVKDNRSGTGLIKSFDVNPIYSSIQHTAQANTAASRQEIVNFVDETMRSYMRRLGFKINSDLENDYIMDVTISEFSCGYYTGLGWSATVRLGIEVYNNENQLVYPYAECVGKSNSNVSYADPAAPTLVLDNAYCRALADIDWTRISSFLKSNPKPKVEEQKPQTQVVVVQTQTPAAASTSEEPSIKLEDTIIRWYIISKPQGADVSWRVVSSSPAVKNTNTNFMGNTPYESTESFDIKGLTYENSGSVQIEVTCEKDGYIPMKKRFNLRQAIDQKEITAKFNLVKEDE